MKSTMMQMLLLVGWTTPAHCVVEILRTQKKARLAPRASQAAEVGTNAEVVAVEEETEETVTKSMKASTGDSIDVFDGEGASPIRKRSIAGQITTNGKNNITDTQATGIVRTQPASIIKIDVTSNRAQCQGNRNTWNAGWGLCTTYTSGRVNHWYCDKDYTGGLYANQVCSECGLCTAPTPAPPATWIPMSTPGICKDDNGADIERYYKDGITSADCKSQCSAQAACIAYSAAKNGTGWCTLSTYGGLARPDSSWSHASSGTYNMLTKTDGNVYYLCELKSAGANGGNYALMSTSGTCKDAQGNDIERYYKDGVTRPACREECTKQAACGAYSAPKTGSGWCNILTYTNGGLTSPGAGWGHGNSGNNAVATTDGNSWYLCDLKGNQVNGYFFCGQTCDEVFAAGMNDAACSDVTWNSSCPSFPIPTGFSATSTLADFCPQKCAAPSSHAPKSPTGFCGYDCSAFFQTEKRPDCPTKVWKNECKDLQPPSGKTDTSTLADFCPQECEALQPGDVVALHSGLYNRFIRLNNADMDSSSESNSLPDSWTWERFTVVDAGNSQVALHNAVFNRFVRMNGDDLDTSSTANSLPTNWAWERFTVVDAGNSQVALHSSSSNRYVKMDGSSMTTSPTSSSLPTGWTSERFTVVHDYVAPSTVAAEAEYEVVISNECSDDTIIKNKAECQQAIATIWSVTSPSVEDWTTNSYAAGCFKHNYASTGQTKWVFNNVFHTNWQLDSGFCTGQPGYAACVCKKAPTPSSDGHDFIDDIKRLKAEIGTTYGQYSELVAATPTFLINMTNFSGLLENRDSTNKLADVSHVFGNNKDDDLNLLFEKTNGYIEILHEAAAGLSGSSFCPFRRFGVIRKCVDIAVCLIQRDVPTYIASDIYALLEEVVARFDQISWGTIENFFSPLNATQAAVGSSTGFECTSSTARSLLETGAADNVSRGMASLLSTSAALERATMASHDLMDSHGLNSSIHETIKGLENAWQPVCEKWNCDHTNYWDVFCASHGHSQALIEAGAPAGLLRSHIRNRVRLEIRVQHFLGSEHGSDAHSAGRFFRFENAQSIHSDSMHSYAAKGRAALKRYMVPYISTFNDSHRALRLVDQEALLQFLLEHPEEFPTESYQNVTNTSDAAALKQRSALMMLEEQDQMDASLSRKGFFKAIGKAVVGAVKAVVKTVSSIVVAVVKFIIEVFKCFGRITFVGATGFAKKFPVNWLLGVGVSLTAAMGISTTEKLLAGEQTTRIQLGLSMVLPFVPGAPNSFGLRAGVGVGGNVGCTGTGCSVSVSVGGVVSALIPPGPDDMMYGCANKPVAFGFKCMKSAGVTISIFCCKITLHDGKNNCR